MKVCSVCGFANDDRCVTCGMCGSSLIPNDPAYTINSSSNFVQGSTLNNVKTCRNCGTPLKDTDIFCKRCGQRVNASDNPSPAVYSNEVQNDNNNGSKKTGKGLTVAIIALSVVLVAVLLVIGYFVFFSDNEEDSDETTRRRRESTTLDVIEYSSENTTADLPTQAVTVPAETTTQPTSAYSEPTTVYQLHWYANTNGGNLNLRPSPSTSGKEIAKIPNGTLLDLDESSKTPDSQKSDRFWYRVYYNGNWGWVASDYIIKK